VGYPANTDWRTSLIPVRESVYHRMSTAVLLTLGSSGPVLLVACVNVARLLLARSGSRAQEFAIRKSMGASRFRIVQQLMIEKLALAVTFGATAGNTVKLVVMQVGGRAVGESVT